MQHLGKLLKTHVEANGLKKRDIADAAGISYNYLSTIFNKSNFDCELWEKLCKASGLNPCCAFGASDGCKTYSDIYAQTVLGPATVTICTEQKALLDLLAEKERLIQVLLAQSGLKIGTPSEQTTPNKNTETL